MRKLDHLEYFKKIKDVHNKSIIVLGKYIDSRHKILVQCKKCRYKWEVAPRSLYLHGCPQCGKIIAKNVKKWNISDEHFLEKIPNNLLKKIKILSPYKNVRSRIIVQCIICGNKWHSIPLYLYKGYGCSICGRIKKGLMSRKNDIEFKKEVELIHGDKIKIIGNYIISKNRIQVECNSCGHKWEPVSTKLIGKHHRGCPNCYSSKGENKIKGILQKNNINFLQEFTFKNLKGKNNRLLRFDFAILDNNFNLLHLLEYDGIHHYKSLNFNGGEKTLLKRQKYDTLKDTYCRNNKIKIIRIPFWNYNKMNFNMIMGI